MTTVNTTTGKDTVSAPAPVAETHDSQHASVEEDDGNADDTESLDSNSSSKKDASSPRNSRAFSRSVTMQTLVQEGVLEPGHGVLSIDYLGKKYCGDLLINGKIVWENLQFASPSSWATFVKKRINPAKKSGCGWNSVKYKGKKLDKLKLEWFRKSSINNQPGLSPAPNFDDGNAPANVMLDNRPARERKAIKYSEINYQIPLDANTICECEVFEGNNQPFNVVVSTSVMLLIDFHSHLTTSEICGYLGGRWDQSKRCLFVMQVFPCKCKLCDQEAAMAAEQEITNTLMTRGLTRVGWYHSHPASQAAPTLRDIDLQYDIQCNDPTHPTIAMINSPYDTRDVTGAESTVGAFWVAQPPDGNPEQYGIPMKITYSEVHDQMVQVNCCNMMQQLVDYYRTQTDVINFNKVWRGATTYLAKIKLSLSGRFGKDKSCVEFLQYVDDLLATFNHNTSSAATTVAR